MINAELNYNPYLRETNIKFNGQVPRVNSLVEKYLMEPLQTWADKIPRIFYDEMNGYDFELIFTGTALDCAYVRNAFRNANVSEESVRIFHKNELDPRKVKLEYIDLLLSWLQTHQNRKFDYELFVQENNDTLETNFTCVLLNMETDVVFEDYPVSFESIDEIHDLDNTDLKNTPIVLSINNQSIKLLGKNVEYLLARKDVLASQIFFIVGDSLKVNTIERTIKDLGIDCPQTIGAVNDDLLKRYLDIYPVTDYINKVIHLLRAKEKTIYELLEKEKLERVISNKEIHLRLDQLEGKIRKLKTSAELFVHRDNLEDIPQLQTAKLYLNSRISSWRNRKTKITKEQEAIFMSEELVSEIQNGYQTFVNDILNCVCQVREQLESDYRRWFRSGGMQLEYSPEVLFPDKTNECALAISNEDFLQLKEEKYVTAKEDLLGKLFKPLPEKNIDLVLETTYYCQKWREHALHLVASPADEIIQKRNVMLKKYAHDLAEQYLLQLEHLIDVHTEEKNLVSSQLSEEERKLQLDHNWFVEFQEQLRRIERG